MKAKTLLSHQQSSALTRHMLLGAGIALVLVLLFLWRVGESDPTWSSLWWVRPIMIIPFAGAIGGSWIYFMNHHMISNKILAMCVAILGYIGLLWIGSVLGFVGTLWN